LPNEKTEREAADDDIGPSLDRRRNELCPPPLARWPGRSGVRNSEDEQEQGTDEDRGPDQALRPRIDRFRDEQIPDEADRVEERGENGEVARDTVEQGRDRPAECAFHEMALG
jgi:hypothetical protein